MPSGGGRLSIAHFVARAGGSDNALGCFEPEEDHSSALPGKIQFQCSVGKLAIWSGVGNHRRPCGTVIPVRNTAPYFRND
jgi:hypothetical protein